MASERQIRANRENAKKAGRPRGKVSQKTLDAMKVRERIKQRTLAVADVLFESQLSLAVGAQYLFRIDKEFIKTGEGKNGDRGYWRNKKPVMVTNPEEMAGFLEKEFCSGDAEDEYDESAAYYFLSARDPMNQSIDSMQDRSLGKVTSALEVNVNFPKPIYGGKSNPQLKAAQKQLPPKKVKATILPNLNHAPRTTTH